MPGSESTGRVTESGQTDPRVKDCPCTCTSCMLPSISCVKHAHVAKQQQLLTLAARCHGRPLRL
ncbi:hypothetical protein BC831DRAFT_472462 [Entophlyctis helioformis]|nr:hypothetical protein BC831DRAFT_472462 [Entophlyctis helioformis]